MVPSPAPIWLLWESSVWPSGPSEGQRNANFIAKPELGSDFGNGQSINLCISAPVSAGWEC